MRIPKFNMTPKAGRMLVGFAWTLSGALVSRAAPLIVSVVAARMLGAERFGIYGAVSATTAMFLTFASFGITALSSRYIAAYLSTDPAKAQRIASLALGTAVTGGLVGSIALYIASHWLAVDVYRQSGLTPLLLLSSPLVFLSGVAAAQSGILLGLEEFRDAAIAAMFSGIVSMLFTLLGLWHGGLNGLVVGFIASNALGIVFTQMLVTMSMKRRGLKLLIAGAMRELPVLWHYGVPAVLGNLLITPVTWGAYAILARSPAGLKEVAISNVASQWRLLLLFLPAVIAQMLLPMFSRGNYERSPEHSSVLMKLVWWHAIGGFAGAAFLAAISGLILPTYGPEFASYRLTFAITQVFTAIQIAESPAVKFIESSGEMWSLLWLNCFWSVVTLATTWVLSEQGALGYAIAQLCGFAAHGFVLTLAFRSIVRRRLYPTIT